jgi:hypothetical protein
MSRAFCGAGDFNNCSSLQLLKSPVSQKAREIWLKIITFVTSIKCLNNRIIYGMPHILWNNRILTLLLHNWSGKHTAKKTRQERGEKKITFCSVGYVTKLSVSS